MTNRVLSLLNLLLVAGMIYLGVNIFYKIASARLIVGPESATRNRSPDAVQTETTQPIASYKPIEVRNLFNLDTGAEEKPLEKVAVEKLETLKQTELKVKLWGTVTSNTGKTYAVIEETKGRQQNLYRVGDTIQNALVKMILRDKVVLHANGKDEILEMEEVKTGSRSTRRAPRQVARSGRAPQPRAPQVPLEQNIILKKPQLEAALKEPETLAEQVKFRPHFKDGQPDGLLLTGIKPNSIFRRMGLRNGDLLTGINEDEVDSVEGVLRFYQDLESNAEATIQIKRRGRLRTINYKIE